jgi:hypothetical protein
MKNVYTPIHPQVPKQLFVDYKRTKPIPKGTRPYLILLFVLAIKLFITAIGQFIN